MQPTLSFSQQLKAFRVSLGYSQDAMARVLGVGVATYYRWEHDMRQPTHANLRKLIRIGFKEDFSDMIDDATLMEPQTHERVTRPLLHE